MAFFGQNNNKEVYKSMKEFTDKVFEGFMRFASTKTVTALKDGFVLTMPATLIGSVFLLIANLPFNGYADFMARTFGNEWNAGLNQVSACTFDILAIIIAVGIGYAYAKNEGLDGIACGILSLISFLIVSASTVITDAGEEVGGVIPRNWTGGNGVIAAIIVGILVGKIFTLCIKRNIRIKMPAGVPDGVSNAFSALIPGFFVILASMIVYQVCMAFGGLSLTELIFKVIQIPLQNLSSTWAGGIIIVLLISVLFWAGLHGPNIVMGVMAPILTANALANQALIDAGKAATVSNGARLLTPQIIDCFVKFGGTGITLGLLIAAIISAKSKQLKEISKLSIVPGLFNINEPVIFGLPIVYNPILLVPFIVVPLVSFIITYGAASIGFLAPFGSVQVPWTTPVIISGFLLGGWRAALIQVIVLAASVLIYYPFLKKQDVVFLEQEKASESE